MRRTHLIATLVTTLVVLAVTAAPGAAAEGVPQTEGRGMAEYVAISIGVVVVVLGLFVAQVRRNRAERADAED